MDDFEYTPIKKWGLQTKETQPENIATCVAENKVIAIEYFAQMKRLTVEQLLFIYQVVVIK